MHAHYNTKYKLFLKDLRPLNSTYSTKQLLSCRLKFRFPENVYLRNIKNIKNIGKLWQKKLKRKRVKNNGNYDSNNPKRGQSKN